MGAAPPERVRQEPACIFNIDVNPTKLKRRRCRGPRSVLASLRRAVARHCRSLPDPAPGESGALGSVVCSNSNPQLNSSISNKHANSSNNSLSTSQFSSSLKVGTQDLKIYMQNVRSLRAHKAELMHHLERLQPHIVLIQETWLDSASEEIILEGFHKVSRRDRAPSPNRGGIAAYARQDFKNMVHIEDSDSDERSWHFISLDAEVLLLANWYRSPSSEDNELLSFREELSKHAPDATGLIIVGDLTDRRKVF